MTGGWVRLVFLFLSAAGAVVSAAEPPSLDSLFPAGVVPGTTNLLTVTGKFSSWPPRFWISGTGLTVSATTNKGVIQIIADSGAPVGPRLLRLFNDDGAGEPRILVVGAGREMTEIEPNNLESKAQDAGPLPVTINGRLDKKDDVDSFSVRLQAGQWLEARVDCYTLLSKVDAVLRLVRTNGQPLAWNHDFITLDPRLIWRAATNETVIVQLFGFAYPADSEIRLTGGDATAYRLHLSATTERPEICPPQSGGSFAREPAILPAVVSARLESGTNEHRYLFSAKKGQVIEARLEAGSLGSLLDPWIRIEDSTARELARADDSSGGRDPSLEWKAPADGQFSAVVGSMTHRGGEDYCYRLRLDPVGPDFRATLAASGLVLTAGATNELKLNLKRLRGFTNELAVALPGGPSSVTLLTTNLGGREGSISLQVSAESNAPPFQGPVQVELTDTRAGISRRVPFELISKSQNNGVPQGYSQLLINSTDDLWLTVRPAATK